MECEKELAGVAAGYGRGLIGAYGNTLSSGIASEFGPMDYEKFSTRMKAQAEKNLARTGEALKARDVNASYIYREGKSAAQEIINYAADNSFDLIAMATHGTGEIAWVIGSVTEKVVSHATVPVLVLRVLSLKAPGKKESIARSA